MMSTCWAMEVLQYVEVAVGDAGAWALRRLNHIRVSVIPSSAPRRTAHALTITRSRSRSPGAWSWDRRHFHIW